MVGWILRNIVGMGWMVLIYLPFTCAHPRCYGTVGGVGDHGRNVQAPWTYLHSILG